MEHPELKSIFQEVMESISADASKIEPNINHKMETSVETCMSKSSKNPDKFASCMMNTQKKVAEMSESFQLKNLFLANTIRSCLNEGNDSAKCSQEGKKLAVNIITSFLKEIEKI